MSMANDLEYEAQREREDAPARELGRIADALERIAITLEGIRTQLCPARRHGLVRRAAARTAPPSL